MEKGADREELIGKMSVPTWREMGLTDQEYASIVSGLGREPNYTELGVFAVLWSEHCGYKHSKSVLRTLPTKGPRILVGPGENAGVVDIGDGMACAFKIESHNHPSAIEPYHGAATGIGGIVRDVLAMGARPVLLTGSLWFGPVEVPHSRSLLQGAVAGAADYGNTLDVPTVGLDLFFAQPYAQNPLVNVLCAGLMRHEDIHKGRAYGVGNVVMVAGNRTGRDGIHGCTFASDVLGEETVAKPPDIVKGDPLTEKLLIEACLRMMSQGAVLGIQDMGAAGIASSCAETAARAGTGLHIDIDKVPVREEAMTAYEILLSESQERMLLIVKPDKVSEVLEIGAKWGVEVTEIGRVNDSGELQVSQGGVLEASIPLGLLADSVPVYTPESAPPEYLAKTSGYGPTSIPELEVSQYQEVLLKLLSSPNIASRTLINKQFDHMARADTVIGPGAGAGMIRVRGTSKGIAFASDANPRFVYLDPHAGGAWAVVSSALCVASVGARPLAISNCLNFGNPEKPGIYWQFVRATKGMADACIALLTPITGGNVSFYNETGDDAAYPTPVVAMLGLSKDVEKRPFWGWRDQGDAIGIVGTMAGDWQSLSGSEYQERIHDIVGGAPRSPDLTVAGRLVEFLLEGAERGILKTARNLSLGGLGVALAQCSIEGQEGARGCKVSLHSVLHKDGRADALLFGESDTVALVSWAKRDEEEIRALSDKYGVPLSEIGFVVASGISIELFPEQEAVSLGTDKAQEAWESGLSQWLR